MRHTECRSIWELRAELPLFAQAGVGVVVNGRIAETLKAASANIGWQTGSTVRGVVADVTTRKGREVLLADCPSPDILVNAGGLT